MDLEIILKSVWISKIHTITFFVKLLILRYQFIGITLSKPHLVCTFYNKQINAKKYEWKFGSVQILMARQCIFTYNTNIFTLIDISNVFQMLHSYCTNILLLLTIHNTGGYLLNFLNLNEE